MESWLKVNFRISLRLCLEAPCQRRRSVTWSCAGGTYSPQVAPKTHIYIYIYIHIYIDSPFLVISRNIHWEYRSKKNRRRWQRGELFDKLDRDDNGRLTVSEFLDYVFDDDSAAGVAIETIDQIKEFLTRMKNLSPEDNQTIPNWGSEEIEHGAVAVACCCPWFFGNGCFCLVFFRVFPA